MRTDLLEPEADAEFDAFVDIDIELDEASAELCLQRSSAMWSSSRIRCPSLIG